MNGAKNESAVSLYSCRFLTFSSDFLQHGGINTVCKTQGVSNAETDPKILQKSNVWESHLNVLFYTELYTVNFICI